MHVLMLGWEFPPFITGGLGTACYGLTRALDRRGVQVTFVLPKAVPDEDAQHVNLVSPTMLGVTDSTEITDEQIHSWYAQSAQQKLTAAEGGQTDVKASGTWSSQPGELSAEMPNVRFLGVQAGFINPYQRTAGIEPVGGEPAAGQGSTSRPTTDDDHSFRTDGASQSNQSHQNLSPDAATSAADATENADAPPIPDAAPQPRPASGTDYGQDLMSQVHDYARFVTAAVAKLGLQFDVIHAHDWLTYPAGLRLARLTGRPLVVHVHSTEFDRSGEHVNQQIYDIERRGMHGAMRVITVSQLTRNVAQSRYSVPTQRIEVCYNGVDLLPESVGMTGIETTDRIVLYFGRITYQKGPEYFIRAAKRVLEVMDNVKFVVAGSGDQAQRMIEMAAAMGIGSKVLFTGFLRGKDIHRVFAMADLYVMPSISEPFGIAPLEAIGHDVPVLISKTSGVSEILTHALKVDFWNVDDMADKIVAVLRYPPLGRTLREYASLEVRGITWEGAAQRCEQIYQSVLSDVITGADRSGLPIQV